MLENPHSVHNYGSSVYHTKVLRLFFARSPLSSSTSTPRGTPIKMTGNHKDPGSGHHVLHKTFHIPVVMLPSCVKFNSHNGVILPQQHMEDTMAKVRRWIALKGLFLIWKADMAKGLIHVTKHRLDIYQSHIWLHLFVCIF